MAIYKITEEESDRYHAKKQVDKFLDEKTLKRQKDETHICGDDNVYSPMYRNNTGYILETKNGKIKRLVAHYYFNA